MDILHRDEPKKFGHVLQDNFRVSKEISLATNLQITYEVKTSAVLSLNNEVLWIRQICCNQEMLHLLPQAHISLLDFCVIEKDCLCLKRRVILLKSPESGETLRQLHQLLSRPDTSTDHEEIVKQPTDSHSTSCGLRFTTLQECIFTVSEQYLTIFAPNADRGSKSKSLGTAYSFNLGKKKYLIFHP